MMLKTHGYVSGNRQSNKTADYIGYRNKGTFACEYHLIGADLGYWLHFDGVRMAHARRAI